MGRPETGLIAAKAKVALVCGFLLFMCLVSSHTPVKTWLVCEFAKSFPSVVVALIPFLTL